MKIGKLCLYQWLVLAVLTSFFSFLLMYSIKMVERMYNFTQFCLQSGFGWMIVNLLAVALFLFQIWTVYAFYRGRIFCDKFNFYHFCAWLWLFYFIGWVIGFIIDPMVGSISLSWYMTMENQDFYGRNLLRQFTGASLLSVSCLIYLSIGFRNGRKVRCQLGNNHTQA